MKLSQEDLVSEQLWKLKPNQALRIQTSSPEELAGKLKRALTANHLTRNYKVTLKNREVYLIKAEF